MLNELNLELQGKDRTVVDMISSVNAFKRRLDLLCSKLQRKDLANFQNIASELEKQGKDSALLDSARYTEQVNNITSDFEKRFRDFALLEPIATFMCYPFSEDHEIDSQAQNIGAVFHLNPPALEDEMFDGRRMVKAERAERETSRHGPTLYARSRIEDIKSAFYLFLPKAIEESVLNMTNKEGQRVYGKKWRKMDQMDLQAYVGLFFLECTDPAKRIQQVYGMLSLVGQFSVLP
ncbi:General transcription factor II-I repeat domain containing protein 2 [Dissostichus eleginoides]|uniref:General transcription factor II-I repeat domain containing protein 2 n=1 Tax=Dissostichus eleginoides TaxID=100907 RepID=A0AAD9CMD8_DISEL|nr:General transcription factor II-I repeat domain containing protein 2 [Dissostichus eleginoides]